MSNEYRISNLIHGAKKYDESFFLCPTCAKEAERQAATQGGRIIRTTQPTLHCSACGASENRFEYRA